MFKKPGKDNRFFSTAKNQYDNNISCDHILYSRLLAVINVTLYRK